jgi:ElaB/YqjD/DUF883 family membrane-anchored ribosome-binding protein
MDTDIPWSSITEEECSSAPAPSRPSADEPSLADALVRKTPWWSISTGIHIVAALLIGFLWAVQAREDDEAVVVSPPRKPRALPEMDKPKDLDPNRKILDVEKSVEDPVYRKDAEEAERNETADEEEFQKAKGDSLDYVSDKPFTGKGTYDVIGGGAGGGGRYGTRLGGKRNLVARGGGGSDTEDAVLAALKWLARHQASDGSWRVKDHAQRCGRHPKYKGRCSPSPGQDDYDSGVTGLALLAFLGAGYSHLSRDTHDGICFGDVVRNGLQWMMKNQDPEGCVGPREGHYLYNHAICALAFSEAYGLTGSNLFKDQAQRAIDFTIAAQNPGKAWRYRHRSNDNDTSVTGWAVMALKSAEISGLAFPKSGYEGTRSWLDEVTDDDYGYVGYDKKDDFEQRKAMTAVGIMCRIFMDRNRSDRRLSTGADFLLRHLPEWGPRKTDFYYWYYASLALFQFDGPSGPKWKAWNVPMKATIVSHQNAEAGTCKNGSWEPADRWAWGGGRVYSTAINALTLEVYYRYANVFGTK